jgi:prepilin-type processing-associated H-X9-DG protein
MNNGHQMIVATHLYSADYNDWLPPNQPTGLANDWVKGDMTTSDATNTDDLTNPQFAKLSPYTGPNPSLYKCPADKSTWQDPGGKQWPRVRTFSMNQSVGSVPGENRTVDGPWLDGTAQHKANNPWRTYGRLADITGPSPANLFVFLDEDQYSINDASFGVAMLTNPVEMIDWPGTYHNFACGFAFADGHSEIHKWTDGRTRETSKEGAQISQGSPDNPDIIWMQQRSSERFH